MSNTHEDGVVETLHDRIEAHKQQLPTDHQPFTDKYFQHSHDILEADGTNPRINVKVFARGDGPVPREGLAESAAVVQKYAGDGFAADGELWVTEQDTFETKEPLMIIEGNATDIVELETMYLGALSHRLTAEHPDQDLPDPETFGDNVAAATDIYDEVDVPVLYFGARHFHFDYDHALAGIALDNGAVQTSTDVGSANIGKDGVGTTPHVLTLTLASEYGKEDATRKTAELYDAHIPDDGPGTTLVDTFNREIDDALAVCEWFDETYGEDNWEHNFRVDTCGENTAQGADEYDLDAVFADADLGEYGDGAGVRVAGVAALRDALIAEGYGDQTDIILSSGMGNPEKARGFTEAHKVYSEERDHELFSGVGAGAFVDGIHCTADMYAAGGEELYKTGRAVDAEAMETYKHEHMVEVTA